MTKKFQYPYKCTCGADAFVDVGADQVNRWPCKQCYLALVADRARIAASRKTTPSKLKRHYADGKHSGSAEVSNTS